MNAHSSRLPPPPSESTTADADTAALQALRLLAGRPQLSQRQLSRELGLSLGKTHYVLHALLDKGLVKIHNFRRSDNKLAYAYLLTAKGITEKLRLTRDFLARKEAEFETLRTTIVELQQEMERHPTAMPIAPTDFADSIPQ